MQTQSFELKLRTYCRPVHCPHCQRPLDVGVLLSGQQMVAAAQWAAPDTEIVAREELREIAVKVCTAHHIPFEKLFSRRRVAELVAARRAFAHAARGGFFTTVQIGKFLGVHHTSVLNLLRPPGQRARRNTGLQPLQQKAKGAAA